MGTCETSVSNKLIIASRHRSTALLASQHIWLTSGGHSHQWDQTLSAIRNIKQLVLSSVEGASAENVVLGTSDLYLQRRVFTKVRIRSSTWTGSFTDVVGHRLQCSLCQSVGGG
jgi:hypothetical protein